MDIFLAGMQLIIAVVAVGVLVSLAMMKSATVTSGAKLFLSIAALAALAANVYSVTSENEMVGLIVLASLAVAAAFLGGVSVAFRDAELGTSTTAAVTARAEASGVLVRAPQVSTSPWPLLAGFGLALLAIGAVQDRRLALLGGVVLLAAGVEWVVQSWADRASDDPVYNAGLRSRIMHPVEFPVLGAVIVGFVIWGFSRVMLALPKVGSIWAFIIAGSLILIVASIIALRPNVSSNLAVVALLVGGVAVLVGGVVGIAQGEREFEEHAVGSPDDATQSVSDRASVLDTIVFENQTELPQQSVPRSLNIGMILQNETDEVVRLVVVADERPVGETGETAAAVYRSDPLDEGSEGYLGFRINKPGTYEYRVESVPEGADEAHGGEGGEEAAVEGEPLAVGEIVVP